MIFASRPNAASRIRRATAAAVEPLEGRVLMAGDPSIVQSLPFALDFDAVRAGLADKDGEGTGFTWVQPNKLGNEYQPGLIDLRTAEGLLYLTTSGTSAAGGPFEGDNTLVNGLQTQFNAATGSFTVTVRIKGPLNSIDAASEQAGILFGPDQDNYVKLVVMGQSGSQYLQFLDEQQTTSTTWAHTYSGSGSMTALAGFGTINTLDLSLAGDASTGKLTAWFRVNGGPLTQLAQQLTLTGAKKTAFFSSTARAGLIAMHKNDLGPITVAFDRFEIVSGTPVISRPSVTDTSPAAGATGVRRDTFIDANVHLATSGKGVDAATLNSNTVKLYRSSDRVQVPAHVNTSGGGDSIVLTPTVLLDANTTYTFEVTAELRDTAGQAFLPYTMSFTTGTTVTPVDPTIAFEKVTLPTTFGNQYTALTIGPDGRLYAGTITGLIHRFTIQPDGTLSAPQVINTVQAANNGSRLLTGLEFDPSSTASNLVLWVSHGQYALENATDFTGKVSRLSGGNLESYQDYVVNLPRSVRDHLTNQMDFGPDGGLYISQASTTAMGAPDTAWGMRPEHLLTAAVLRLDTGAMAARIAAGQGLLDAKTPDAGGAYNPWAAGAPLTIYATGVRNAYSLIWHSNGQLYAPTNGSAAHGATPGYDGTAPAPYRIDQPLYGPYPGNVVAPIADVTMTEPDYLFRILQGGYYGHPNPTRGEYVLNGGNPTSGVDVAEVGQYPVGTQPDRNYRGPAYVFGNKLSPNGVVEYQGPSFNGALNGRLLVARFSGGDDVVALRVAADGSIVEEPQTTINGLTGFVDPLDIAVDPVTGNLYVSEYDEANTGNRRITLLRPIPVGGNIDVAQTKMYFNDPRTGGDNPAEQLVIRNTGTAPLSIPTGGLKITGTNASLFRFSPTPSLPLTIPAGGSISVGIVFRPGSAETFTIKTATLEVTSNDADQPSILVSLRGLPTAGTGGQNEPSLQRILDLYQIPVNVGDVNPADTDLFNAAEPLSPGRDEIDMQRLVKAGPGDVTIETLAVFGVSSTPALRFGWYDAGSIDSKRELFTVAKADAQTVSPTPIGVTSFDPGSGTFGVFSSWPGFANQEVYSEDALNTAEANPDWRRKVRFYPLRNPDGSIVPDAYVMAHEEYTRPDSGGAFDNQDIVAIVRNVRPAPAGPEIGLTNLDGAVPAPDRLVFNRIQIQPPELKHTQVSPGVYEDYQPPNNVVHDVATVRVNNTGTAPLVIQSLALDSTAWTLVNPPAPGTEVAPGGWVDVTVKFVATSRPATQTENQTVGAAANTGGLWTGTLTINTNDADEPATVVKLAGWWQWKSEQNMEPTLPILVNGIFGYGTTILNAGETLVHGGQNIPVGEEVLSAYWTRADGSRAVTVRQLVAFHSQGPTETIRSFIKGSTSTSVIFTHDGDEGQSLLPHLVDSAAWAEGVVGSGTAGSLFGFKVQATWSDDTLNTQEHSGGGYGHKIRFFPLRDDEGRIVPNAWILAHDYYATDPLTGQVNSNYDYQDNLYIVTNVRPGVAAPAGLSADSNSLGVHLDWADNGEATLSGYNVYRSTSATSGFVKVNGDAVQGSQFIDASAAVGTTYYYRVTALSSWGAESGNSVVVSAVRTADAVAPAAPGALSAAGDVGGVRLSWAAPPDADVVGYRVYRGTSATGPFSLLNASSLVASPSYVDATGAYDQVFYYQVSAVDGSGNESAPCAPVSATRPSTDLPPAAPAALSAIGGYAAVALRWTANTETDLAGYNVYRQGGDGTFVKVNTVLLTRAAFDDTAAPAGATSSYRVTAVDRAGQESAPATASAFRQQATGPTIVVSGAEEVGEGSDYELTLGDVTYNGTATVTKYVVHWGDGTSDEFAFPGVKSHVFADGMEIRDVTVDLFDGQTTYANAAVQRVTVRDVAPALVIAGPAAVDAGTPMVLAMSSEDAGRDAISGWTVDWGDGTIESFAGDPAAATHVYGRGGTFLVKATATNEDGTFAANAVTVSVTQVQPPPPPPPVNPLDGAIDLGAMGQRDKRLRREALSAEAPGMLYRFTVTEALKLTVNLSGLKMNADVELLDASGNLITLSAKSRKKSEKFVKPLGEGTYYVRVAAAADGGATPFKLLVQSKRPSRRELAML